MADNFNILDDGNATSADLALKLDNTTDILTGNLDIIGTGGVGIARTDGTLHAHTATAGVVIAHTDADELVAENSVAGGISILTPDVNNSNLYFGSPSDSVGAIVKWNYNSNLMSLSTARTGAELALLTANQVEAVRINGGGNVGIGTPDPQRKLHIHEDSSSVAFAAFTNTTTGSTSVDGFKVGIDSSETAQLWNYEATDMAFGTSNAARLTIEADGDITIKGDTLNIATQATPASAAATGTKGDIVHDTGFIYICTATDTWKRVAIATW